MNRLRFNGVLHCFCVISKTELWKDILALSYCSATYPESLDDIPFEK